MQVTIYADVIDVDKAQQTIRVKGVDKTLSIQVKDPAQFAPDRQGGSDQGGADHGHRHRDSAETALILSGQEGHDLPALSGPAPPGARDALSPGASLANPVTPERATTCR